YYFKLVSNRTATTLSCTLSLHDALPISKSSSISSSFKTMGNRPFLKLLLKKISAKLGASTARKPYSSSAQGACSRLEPQPKFSRASSTLAPWERGWLSTKSGFSGRRLLSCPG